MLHFAVYLDFTFYFICCNQILTDRLWVRSCSDDLQITVDSLSQHRSFEKQSQICLSSQQRNNYMTCKNILQILAHTTEALGLSYMGAFPLCALGRFEYILHSTLHFH